VTLDLEQLRTLVAFADSGSCRGAAALVHKTPSAVSLHLGKLAATLGRTLFERQGRHLVLTPDGSELVRYGRRLLAVHGEALAHFQGHATAGTLRVGLPDDYMPLMAPLLARLAQIAPGAHLELRCAPSAELRPLLAEGALDFAVLSAETDTQEGVVLKTERVVWAASARHDVQHLQPLPLALFPDGCIFRKWALAQLRKRRREHRVACTSRSMPAIQAAVTSGFGVAVMAESCVPEGAVVLGPDEGFGPLPAVTIILAASPSADAGLMQRLATPMRSDLQRLGA
jgi:DNA-binding transcriptional LysR family regulator